MTTVFHARLHGRVMNRTNPFIFTSIAPRSWTQPNETCWVFPVMKSTSHFLPQSVKSPRSDSSWEANFNCCHNSDSLPLLEWEHHYCIVEKCRTNNAALRNNNIKLISLWGLTTKSHTKQYITDKRLNKAKYPTWNSKDMSLWRRLAYQTLPKALK